jgi:DNA-binding transcriptional LysR family regulator
MSKFDHSDINGHLLKLLLAIVETGTITAAAEQLGVTQSAVSHLLNKLRAITGDPLFVKSGRGIAPTAHAQALAVQARELLANLERFTRAGEFNPTHWKTTFTIAANELQRDVLLPALMARLRERAPGVALRVVASGIPTLDMLRQEACQLVISPRPPEGTDIMQKRLFEDRYRVFYDPAARAAPKSKQEYLAAEHVTVVYDGGRSLDLDQWMLTKGLRRHFAVMVPGFSGLAPFVRHTERLATAPALLETHLLKGLASAEVPMVCPKLPMFMVWHLRHHDSASHRWLRNELQAVLPAVLPTVLGGSRTNSRA